MMCGEMQENVRCAGEVWVVSFVTCLPYWEIAGVGLAIVMFYVIGESDE